MNEISRATATAGVTPDIAWLSKELSISSSFFKRWPVTVALSGILVAAAPSAALAATSPHYVSIIHQINVARPASLVWARVGHYCDLTKWLGKPCQIVAGRDAQIGATRLVDHNVIETLVGRTATSYTYAQPEVVGSKTHFYHGTLDVEPVGTHASRIVYTLFYDNSAIAAGMRAKELHDRSALFEKAIEKMKSLAEASADG